MNNRGIGIACTTLSGTTIVNGIRIYKMDPITGLAVGDTLIENGDKWKIFQTRVDEEWDRHAYGVKESAKATLYRLTNDAVELGTVTGTHSINPNLFDYPVDFGRFHLIVVYPGTCGDDLNALDDNTDYATLRVVFVSLRTFQEVHCIQEMDEGSK